MSDQIDDLINQHWKSQAEEHGSAPTCGMQDEIVRHKELEAILAFMKIHLAGADRTLRILDLGCGNGFTLERISQLYPQHRYWGVDFCAELVALAGERPGYDVAHGDARALPFDGETFDLVYCERCIINISTWPGQKQALEEVGRVLAPGGYYLMIEAFTDGLDNYNRARRECGLPDIDAAFHNKYLDKELVLEATGSYLTLVPPERLAAGDEHRLLQFNFLSSHYFISRVLYPLVTQSKVIRNSEFVKFFSGLPPIGNYSPVQALIFQRKLSSGL
jgi:SAM-dependent methyltransferase